VEERGEEKMLGRAGRVGPEGRLGCGGRGQLGLRTEREEGERFRFSFFFKTFSNFKFFSNSF
jgi:hypothetical protein